MTAASEHSWMDDVIQGKDYSEVIAADEAARGFSAPGAEHQVTPVKLVVNEFLARKHLFSANDLEGYINTALQNEAGEMIADKRYAAELSESWEGYAESLRSGQIPADSATMTVEEAEAKGTAAVADFEAGYAESRRLLAETVADLHDANEVAVTAETWETLADLDEDGYFSECLGFDAQSALVAAIKAEQRIAVPVPETAAPALHAVPGIVAAGRSGAAAVDFSREAVPVAAAGAAGVLREDSPKRLTGAVAEKADKESETATPARTRPSTEPVQVGRILVSPKFNAAWSASGRKKLNRAMEEQAGQETKAAEDTGPEMA